jgi:hypothetical protein
MEITASGKAAFIAGAGRMIAKARSDQSIIAATIWQLQNARMVE